MVGTSFNEAFYDEDEIEDKMAIKYLNPLFVIEWVEEESYFFKLSAWSNKLFEFYKKIYFILQFRKNEVVRFVERIERFIH